MSNSLLSDSPAFICQCDDQMRFACAGEAFYEEYDGKQYCVLHFPGTQKSPEFEEALERKLQKRDFDFRGVVFTGIGLFSRFDFSTDTSFAGAVFRGDISFDSAVFKATTDFSYSIFSGDTSFHDTIFFAGVDFSAAAFKANTSFGTAVFDARVAFNHTVFAAETSFRAATFRASADFNAATLMGATSFSAATFHDRVGFGHATFSGDASFNAATFLERVDFNSAAFKGETTFREAMFGENTDFNSVNFNTAYFNDTRFTGAAYFLDATFDADVEFNNTLFSIADFRGVSFKAATYFMGTAFSGKSDFSSATLNDANFSSAEFGATATFKSVVFNAMADFRSATFSADAIFDSAAFKALLDFRFVDVGGTAQFSSAAFADYANFGGAEGVEIFSNIAALDFKYATVEKPDHFSFHTLTLRPHWFVEIDASKFRFTLVRWSNVLGKVSNRSLAEQLAAEIKCLKGKAVSSPHTLFAIACRQLAVNAEENHRYEEASRFRYLAMDAHRQQWLDKLRGNFFKIHGKALRKIAVRLPRSLRRDWGLQARTRARLLRFTRIYVKSLNLLSWSYWSVSGYGERVLQAFVVLLGIWFLFGLAFTQMGFARWEPKPATVTDAYVAKRDEVGMQLNLSRALSYSAGVMTLQRPEPRPATAIAQTVVLVETILGPVQAALLALAIRRKFMR